MTIGMFVEPEECYRRRMFEQQQRVEQEARQRQARMDDLRTQLIFDALGERGDEPLLITKVVNWVAKRLNYATNAERVEAKRQLFPEISRLIKIGRLERARRNSVCHPETDAKYQAHLAAMDAMIKHLPGPDL